MGPVGTFLTFTLLPGAFFLAWGDAMLLDILWWRGRRMMRREER